MVCNREPHLVFFEWICPGGPAVVVRRVPLLVRWVALARRGADGGLPAVVAVVTVVVMVSAERENIAICFRSLSLPSK